MRFGKQPNRAISFPRCSALMAPSISSLFFSHHTFPSSSPSTTNHRFTRGCTLSPRPQTFAFFTNSSKNNNNITTPPSQERPSSSSSEKKSLAVATGELFLGIASRLIKSSSEKSFYENSGTSIPVFDRPRKRINGNELGSSESNDKERIGVVMEDEIEPEVIWEQRVKDIEAEKERRVVTSPGFSFSAAGLLFPYHLGVAQFLIEKGYIKETTPLAGSSAGAIVCAVIASGASMHEALKATKILADDCRLKGTAFRLGAVLRDVLDKFLPHDVHTRSNGRVRVAVTQILWRPRGLLVDQFDSKEDLINAVITSSFIPGYLAPRPATMFRNRLCIDGGLTLFMPPTSAAKTVRVCAFPASRLGLQGIGISPDCNPENRATGREVIRATGRELFNWALEPADDNILDWLFELGYLDAAVWGEQNPVEEIVTDDGVVENGSAK
ncbi:PREDICTED: patatin-like phospholipase domain-containing protein 4 isoform X1 [Theobroma cacao]|uniref:Patatin n=1 Tax=Theobroma cacao TaxID=3641 RepID=A0AB32W149_THECC|nr:PREDICTED: patatin-like phospholipase domain-containing protein 4 isoform X1 [Theobroma cacao]